MHALIFGIDEADRLSSAAIDNNLLLLTAPIVGGVLLGIMLFILAHTRKKPMVDPIEANALHGGRMSLTDSIIVAVQNLISNGFGASVGLEAGYTQLASGLASKLGEKLQLRRADLRNLVGCGAAGAIAAAFNAPLTGAFYAFELIIGTYTIVNLTPVVVSALISTLVARLFAGDDFVIDVGAFRQRRSRRLYAGPAARRCLRRRRHPPHAGRVVHRGAGAQEFDRPAAASCHRRHRRRPAGADLAAGAVHRPRRAASQPRDRSRHSAHWSACSF